MSSNRHIAYDATFMILYIGFSAAMVALTVTLWALLALGTAFGGVHLAAAALNLAGWAFLPFASQLYARILGLPFSWRSNEVLGGAV